MEQSPAAAAALLQRYRLDRRKLMEFLLSSGLIKELRTPSGLTDSFSDIDFDTISADHVLRCIQSGGVLDITEATEKYFEESASPVMIQAQAGCSYFLVSDADSSGSPPRRMPPPISVKQAANSSTMPCQTGPLEVENFVMFGDYNSPRYKTARSMPLKASGNSAKASEIPPLGLPSLKTGLSDDDLRESAYELLMASMFLSGDEVQAVEDKKKEKGSKLLSGLKSKKDKTHPQHQSLGRNSAIMDIVRVQMQISEKMHACIRRNLLQLAARRINQIDLPHIALELLNGIFKSDFPNEKSYMQWRIREANILEELLCFATNSMETEVRSQVAKIRDTEQWDAAMSPSERVAVIASIRQVATKLSSLPQQFGIEGETFYWTAGYHLNIRLYQNLLCAVFDSLDEDQLTEEVDDLLSVIKLTWPTLGITPKMHNALYGWVLFQQFLETDGDGLLENAVLELQKLLPAAEDDDKEEQYMDSLLCIRQWNGIRLKVRFVQEILLSVSSWCDSVLQDYHLHFNQKFSNFRMVMTLVSEVGIPIFDDCGEIKLTKLNASNPNSSRILKSYVMKSTEAAYSRVASKIDLESKVERTHPLTLLANELKLIAEREFKVFYPVLRESFPESVKISVFLLHQFYGEKLKPFLEGLSSLSEDVKLVLPAADMLDHYLTQLYTYTIEASKVVHSPSRDLDHYQIGELSKPLILDWVISQHAHILEWSGRAFDIEDWEPLSFHQKQAASIVEVFRIIEETVAQFFGLNLPMDITHLQALLSIIFHSLDAYLQKMLNQLVEKIHLYPPVPPLTRYTETVIPLIRKKLPESTVLENHVTYKLNELTISKLCIRLNTLQYIHKQVKILEDGIGKSWALVRPSHNEQWTKEETLEERSLLTSEATCALFATTLDIIRDTAKEAIHKICEFTGTKVVFWDLRDRFLFQLYRGDVESSRLENFLPHVDAVLGDICGLIDNSVRDLLVSSIYRASVEAYVWVLLDGGPSRAYSDSDYKMIEDDFHMLKEFFVANGDGLPRSLVEQEAKFAHRIISLFSLQTETVIQMLMSASEHISIRLDSQHSGPIHMEDAHTLIRILCHKKDREASMFLKRQYQLPMSSEYDDAPSRDSTSRSPLITDLLQRSASFHWTGNGQTSFKSIRKKLQEATSGIRNMGR